MATAKFRISADALDRSDWGNGDMKTLMLDVLNSYARGEPC